MAAREPGQGRAVVLDHARNARLQRFVLLQLSHRVSQRGRVTVRERTRGGHEQRPAEALGKRTQFCAQLFDQSASTVGEAARARFSQHCCAQKPAQQAAGGLLGSALARALRRLQVAHFASQAARLSRRLVSLREV